MTPDVPYEPDLDPEDAAEVLAQTNGRTAHQDRSNAEARLDSPASASEREARERLLVKSSASYTDRMLQLAAKWDSGQQPTEEEIEYMAGRGALEALIDPMGKPMFKAKAIDQVLRIREKRLLAPEVAPAVPGAKPPAPAVTLPGAPRLVTG